MKLTSFIVLLAIGFAKGCTELSYKQSYGYELYDVLAEIGLNWSEYALNISRTFIEQYNANADTVEKITLDINNPNHHLISLLKELSIVPMSGPVYSTYFSITFTARRGEQDSGPNRTLIRFKGEGSGGGTRFTYYRIFYTEVEFK